MEEHKWLIARIGIGATAILLVLFVHWPVVVSIWRTLDRIDHYENQLDEARDWQQIRSRLNARIQHVRTRLAAMEQGKPQIQVQSGILNFINGASKKSGLSLSFIKPRGKEEKPEYNETQIELGLVGRYHEFGEFLYLLESSENAINIQRVQLVAKGLTNETLNAVLTLSFYQLKLNATKDSRS